MEVARLTKVIVGVSLLGPVPAVDRGSSREWAFCSLAVLTFRIVVILQNKNPQ